MLYKAKHTDPAPSVTANDPSAVFLVKSLLYPLATVVTLCACVLWRGGYPFGPYFLLGVLAFITAAEFLDVAPLGPRHSLARAVVLNRAVNDEVMVARTAQHPAEDVG